MNVSKTIACVFTTAVLACGLTACGSSTEDQRTTAIQNLSDRGYTDVRFTRDEPSPPFGDGLMYFMTVVGVCEDIEVAVKPGVDEIVLFANLDQERIDSILKNAKAEGRSFFDYCLHPNG